MAFLVIILCDSFTDLDGRGANYGVQVSVVIGSAPEDFDAESSFLKRLCVAVQRALDNEAEQIREALALAKQRAREDALKLFPNGVALGFGLRRPGRGMPLRIDGRPSLRTISPGDNFITSGKGVPRRGTLAGWPLQFLRPEPALGAVVEPDAGENDE